MTAASGEHSGPVCGCGVSIQPWRTRDAALSPASFFFGLVWLAGGLAIALLAPRGNVVGWAMVGVCALALIVSLVIALTRGHRLGCAVGRAVWTGIAAPGLPVRILVTLPF